MSKLTQVRFPSIPPNLFHGSLGQEVTETRSTAVVVVVAVVAVDDVVAVVVVVVVVAVGCCCVAFDPVLLCHVSELALLIDDA